MILVIIMIMAAIVPIAAKPIIEVGRFYPHFSADFPRSPGLSRRQQRVTHAAFLQGVAVVPTENDAAFATPFDVIATPLAINPASVRLKSDWQASSTIDCSKHRFRRS
jgi:hypothetical protein